MIEIRKLVLKNFGSYKYQEFTVEYGIHLVIGENKDDNLVESIGSGKSYLFNAITYLIYGKTNSFNMKRVGSDNAFVKGILNINKDKITIKRYVKDITFNNKVFLTINSKDETCHTIKETQNIINRIINLSYTHWISSIILVQGMPITMFNMTPTLRKDYFVSLLPINFVNALKLIKKDLLILSKSIVSSTDTFNSLNLDKSKIEGELIAYKDKPDKIEFDKTEIKEYKNKQKNILIKYNNIVIKLGKFKQDNEEILNKFNTALIEQNKELKQVKYIIDNGRCTVCNSKVNTDMYSKYDMQDKLIKKTNLELTRLTDIYTIQLKDLELELKDVERDKYKIDSHLEEITLNSNIPDKDLISKITNKRNHFVLILATLEAKIEIKQREQNKLIKMQALLASSGEIRALLITNYIGMFNNIFNNILKNVLSINNKVKIKCVLQMEGTELNFVTNRNYSLSGGESRLLNLILQLAFSEFINILNNVKINLLVFDESFEGLDNKIVSILLSYIESQFSSRATYVITHDSLIKSTFKNIIKVTKENSISIIKECKNG